MGAWAGQPNIGGMQPQQQGGDVPPFDLPQAPQGLRQGGQGPMPNLQGQGPMPGGNMQDRWPVVNPPSERFMDPNYYLPQFYQQELGREADQAGMDYWRQQFDNGMSMDQIRQMFDQSQEGQAYNQRPQYQHEINNLYRQHLGREADQAGMDHWRQMFENGMSIDQMRQMFDQSQEGQAYKNAPPRFSNDPRNPHMPPEIADALRLANQPRPVFGSGPNDGGSMPRGVKDLLAGLLPPQPNYNRAPPSQEELDYAQRLGKEPFSPEVQDALRIARGLPVY